MDSNKEAAVSLSAGPLEIGADSRQTEQLRCQRFLVDGGDDAADAADTRCPANYKGRERGFACFCQVLDRR